MIAKQPTTGMSFHRVCETVSIICLLPLRETIMKRMKCLQIYECGLDLIEILLTYAYASLFILLSAFHYTISGTDWLLINFYLISSRSFGRSQQPCSGCKQTKGKECSLGFRRRSWGGRLFDMPKVHVCLHRRLPCW